MIVLIDNFDSFLHNLARYLRRLGQEVLVLRNDAAELLEVIESQADAIVISPGPCDPDAAGQCLEVVRRFSGQVPIFGVCLGHQVIYQAFGGAITRAEVPVHGRSTMISLETGGLFDKIASPTAFARYHSLVGDRQRLPSSLRVTATAVDSQEIMAVQHVSHRTFGVQFHPESVLSCDGYRILANFLREAGLVAGEVEGGSDTLPTSDLQADDCEPSATVLHYQASSDPSSVRPATVLPSPPR
ncbi:MAG: aminodeoxychorismate synthase component 2 [Aureliella sp.]